VRSVAEVGRGSIDIRPPHGATKETPVVSPQSLPASLPEHCLESFYQILATSGTSQVRVEEMRHDDARINGSMALQSSEEVGKHGGALQNELRCGDGER
jgi:hypothetical protein